MARKFCSKCETMHNGPCSVAALARAGNKTEHVGSNPTRSLRRAAEVTAEVTDQRDSRERPAPKGKSAPEKPATDWKTKYEALVAKQRKETLERVRRHRAKKAKK